MRVNKKIAFAIKYTIGLEVMSVYLGGVISLFRFVFNNYDITILNLPTQLFIIINATFAGCLSFVILWWLIVLVKIGLDKIIKEK